VCAAGSRALLADPCALNSWEKSEYHKNIMPINQRIITSGEIAMEIEVVSTGEATVAVLLNVNYMRFRVIT